jgi:hypothetical protein
VYLDIDIHHADGVEEAFAGTRSVVTVSFHKHGHGFFPGGGGLSDAHGPRGRDSHFHSLNLPMPDGVTDGDFVPFFAEVLGGLFRGHEEDSASGGFKVGGGGGGAESEEKLLFRSAPYIPRRAPPSHSSFPPAPARFRPSASRWAPTACTGTRSWARTAGA